MYGLQSRIKNYDEQGARDGIKMENYVEVFASEIGLPTFTNSVKWVFGAKLRKCPNQMNYFAKNLEFAIYLLLLPVSFSYDYISVYT